MAENHAGLDIPAHQGDQDTSVTAGGPPPAVLLEHVTKTYKTRGGTIDAVRDVSLRAGAGQVISMVGPSGCGKSTVLKMVAGLIPADQGRMEVFGEPAGAGRRDCGIMLQSPVLLPWRTVLDNVLLPIEIFRLDRRAARERASALLQLVGLSGFESQHPWELSGGMQQRVSLARLLVFEPKILLLDEPFAALDEFTRERLNFEVLDIHERLSPAVVYITHNILEAVITSDVVFVMTPRPGRIVDAVEIELPRPRTRAMIESSEALRYVARIRHALDVGGERTGGTE
jgi:NitT/TauT family transport system ATP-binding protein